MRFRHDRVKLNPCGGFEGLWRLCQVVESLSCETATHGEVSTTKGLTQYKRPGALRNKIVNQIQTSCS